MNKITVYDCNLIYLPKKQNRRDPNEANVAVIPKFIMKLIKHVYPVFYGDGSVSRVFTYIDEVLQVNSLAYSTNNNAAINQVYNVEVRERNELNMLVKYLKKFSNKYDSEIANIEIKYVPSGKVDISHSLASIEKAAKLLGYKPKFNFEKGLKLAAKSYLGNIKN